MFGAATVTVTFAAKLTVVTGMPFTIVVVMVELFRVPRVQSRVPVVTALPQLPWLALALVDPEFVASLSMNTTPATGSPVL